MQDSDKLEKFEDLLRSNLFDELSSIKRSNYDSSTKFCKKQVDQILLLAKDELAQVL